MADPWAPPSRSDTWPTETIMSAMERSAAIMGLLLAAASPACAQEHVRDRVYLEADELIEDRTAGQYIARGNVRLQAQDRLLLTEELVYIPAQARVIARGGVQIFDGSEPAQFADEVELSDDLREGVARGFTTLLDNNGRAAAGVALRRPDNTIELSNAYYTACKLCETGESEPTWRLRASRVVRDTTSKVIYYRNVRLEVLGRPILYAPVFAHADPSAARQSGFLFPIIGNSSRTGFSYQQPYLWAIGPSQELVVSPRYMNRVNPLIQLDWTRRFYAGQLSLRSSFTYEQEFNREEKFGEEAFRGHVFAEGLFNLSTNWRWGFSMQAVTGDLYLRRYGYEESPGRDTGLFLIRDQRLLTSQLYLIGSGENFHGDVSAIHFNRLQENFNDSTLPVIGPLVRFSAGLPFPEWAGDFDFGFNAVNLLREQGDSHARASMELDWRRPSILPGGVRTEAFALGRVDAYSYQNTLNGVQERTDLTRLRGAIGLDVSLPLVRPGQMSNWIIAPRIAVIAANGGDEDQHPANLDSVSINFQRTQLFDIVRANGYDLWEDGARADMGLTVAVDWNDKPLPGEAEVFAGRSYRLDGDKRFGPDSGLAGDASDWIGQAKLDLNALSFNTRVRIDSATSAINRLDVNASLETWRVNLRTRYTRRVDNTSAQVLSEITANMAMELTEHWSVVYRGTIDEEENDVRRQSAGLQYLDECTSLRVFYERDNIAVGRLGPGESVRLEVVLFTLGGTSGN